MIHTRKQGERLVDAQERELYKIYLKSRRGENLPKLDQSICDLFSMVKDNNDVPNMIKLSDRLAKREWYGLAYRVQEIIAKQQKDNIESWRCLAALAIQNQDFDRAKVALEQAQSQLTFSLLKQAADQADLDAAISLYEKAVYVSGDMDRVEVLFQYAKVLQPDQALVKLQEARTTLQTLAKEIIDNRGVVPSHYSEKANALPLWRDRIEAKIRELEGNST